MNDSEHLPLEGKFSLGIVLHFRALGLHLMWRPSNGWRMLCICCDRPFILDLNSSSYCDHCDLHWEIPPASPGDENMCDPKWLARWLSIRENPVHAYLHAEEISEHLNDFQPHVMWALPSQEEFNVYFDERKQFGLSPLSF